MSSIGKSKLAIGELKTVPKKNKKEWNKAKKYYRDSMNPKKPKSEYSDKDFATINIITQNILNKKKAEIVASLVKLANHLDETGNSEEADMLDEIIKNINQVEKTLKEI